MNTYEFDSAVVAARPEDKSAPSVNSTRKHIRGSTLLLVGRIVSLGINFLVQVLTVRYLTKSDYGAFAYALGIVSMSSSILLFGLDKAVSRFIPIYQEHRDYDKMFGAIVLATGTILGLGLSLAVLLFGVQGVLAGRMIKDPLALALLLIMILLAPAQSYDSLFQGLLAIFASPKAIFFRRYVLGPGLKLAAVLVVMITASDVYTLAYGYLIGGLLGIVVYVVMIVQVWHRQGMLRFFKLKLWQLPFREIFGFGVPLLTTDVVLILRSSLVLVMLEYFQSTIEVAEFRAVMPVAKLNLVVLQSFSFLFLPLAARMFARNDNKGINDLYWQTTLWITVMTFPVFALTFSLAQPLTLLLFGDRYVQSAVLLALLSFGYYVNAALGFNSHTLRVYGKVRYIVVIDALSAVIGLGINLWLIPRYGALGAAIGTTSTLVAHKVFNHVGLFFGGTGIKLFEWGYMRVYLIIAIGTAGLLFVQWLAAPPAYVSFVLAAIVSLLIIRLNRTVFNIEEMFPELLRFPMMRWLLTDREK